MRRLSKAQTTTANAPKSATNPPTVPPCTLPAALLGALIAELVVELGEELLDCDELDELLEVVLLFVVMLLLVVLEVPVVEVDPAEVLVVPPVDADKPPVTAKAGEKFASPVVPWIWMV
jgi:hypothetical protein